MKRSLVTLFAASLACNTSTLELPDASTPIQITAQPLVTITPGGTATVDLAITAGDDGPATIDIGPLPTGLTSESVAWTGASSVSLQLTASSDAPVSETITNVNATVKGASIGSTTITIDVSSLDGALDPTFGQGGAWTLPLNESARPASIALVANGAWLVGGTREDDDGSPSVLLARVIATGALDASYGQNGFLAEGALPGDEDAADVDGSGNVAVLVATTTGTYAATVDPSGNAGTQSTTLDGGCEWIAWDGAGGAFVTGNVAELVHLDASLSQTDLEFVTGNAAAGLLVNAGDAYVPTLSEGVTNETLFRWSPTSPGVYAIDPTFAFGEGTQIALDETPTNAMAVDSQGRVLVAVEAEAIAITRVLANGVVDESFGTGGTLLIDPREINTPIAPIALFPQSDGKVIVAAEIESAAGGIVLTRFTDDGVDTTFGTYGITRALFDVPTTTVAAAYDATNERLCTVNDTSTQSIVTSTSLICFHVTP